VKIRWLGHACFLAEGRDAALVTDPFDDSIGLQPPSVEADVVTVSHDHFDHNATGFIRGNPTVVRGPGERGVAGVKTIGIETFHDATGGSQRGPNTVFVIEMDGLRLCHCGDLGHILAGGDIERIGVVDVLFVPVGGTYTLDAEGASAVASALSPRVTVPMHYRIPGLSLGIAGVEPFLSGKASRRLDVLEIDPASAGDVEGVVVLAAPSTQR